MHICIIVSNTFEPKRWVAPMTTPPSRLFQNTENHVGNKYSAIIKNAKKNNSSQTIHTKADEVIRRITYKNARSHYCGKVCADRHEIPNANLRFLHRSISILYSAAKSSTEKAQNISFEFTNKRQLCGFQAQ